MPKLFRRASALLLFGLNLAFAAQVLAQHNSRNSLDWEGVYQGILPCADCEGIETRITLTRDGDFVRQVRYLGREDRPYTYRGRFTWDDAGGRVTLSGDGANDQQFRVGENVLFHLDRNGQRITGDLEAWYRLAKKPIDPRLEGRLWRLAELFDGPPTDKSLPELEFSRFGDVSGTDGCNRLSGSYALTGDGGLRMGDFATTMMACPDMQTPDNFKQGLTEVTAYRIENDVLTLLNDSGRVVARFDTVSE
jgi:heat shock protein HslJ